MADSIEGEASEVAARYAQAVFELALDFKAVDGLEQDFTLFAGALAESADLRAAIRSPLIEPEDMQRALTVVAERLGLSDLGRKVIGLTAQNGRAFALPALRKAYGALAARHRGAKQVEIISAVALDPAQLNEISNSLSGVLGGRVEAVTRVDPSLLGGFIVQAGSRQFDASLKTKLENLKLSLKGA